MPIARRDLFALLLVVAGAIASVVVWDYGRVDLGMTVEAIPGEPPDQNPFVLVGNVTADGNAARSDFYPYSTIIDLTTVDGTSLERGEPIGEAVGALAIPRYSEVLGFFAGIGGPLTFFDADHRPPIEAVESSRIATAMAGQIDFEQSAIHAFASIDRGVLEHLLRESMWVAVLGVAAAVVVWGLLARGFAGKTGREVAIVVGAATAAPFVLLPVVQVGTPMGIYAGYLVPTALALLLGLALARKGSDTAQVRMGVGIAVAAAALVVLVVVQHMTTPNPSGIDRWLIIAVVAAVGAVPAVFSFRAGERAGGITLGVMPAAALTLIAPRWPDPWLPAVLLVALLGWRLLPLGRLAVIGDSFGRLRGTRRAAPNVEPVLAAWRDRACYGLLGVSVVIGLIGFAAWSLVAGVGLAVLVGVLVRRGFMGAEWTDAAVPLAAAVGVPVILFPYEWLVAGDPVNTIPTALAALGVAHVLAARHSDPAWRTRLFAGSAGLVALIVLLTTQQDSWAVPLIGGVALIPALPAALAIGPDGPREISSRLETLAVGLTPGAAATVLLPPTNGVLLALWLIAVVVWRQFTLNPLMGFAQRTQLQRDLAVAAAETERARLAADLHDDALQQLTMLVRTLDEAGQADAAAEAREVATKLRSVVGDLRLPILDDLGAGAALEWLVERIEPLAGGPVKLERTDTSRPPANVELAVFRVAQEALNNAVRHGRAPIAVRYDVSADGRVTLAVDDAGSGIEDQAAEEAPRDGHFGLANMQQRAEQIGALLDVRRWPAGGTRVAFEWRPR